MNNCILMAEINTPPQLRHTPDNLEMTEMMVIFPGLRGEDPPATLRVISWGKTASEIHTNYQPGDRVILEGRLGMRTFDRPEGFKEKRAELTVQRIYRVSGEMNLGTQVSPMTAPPTPAPMASYEISNPNPTPTPSYQPPAPTPTPSYQPPAPAPSYSEDYDSDDIPF